MAGRPLFLVVLSILMVLPASAQDATAVLEAASAAMGAGNLNSIQYSGTEGWVGAVGQSFAPGENYPRVELTRYTRTIDYGARSSKEEVTVIQGDYPARGGGRMPIRGERQRTSMVSGNYAWNMQGDNLNPAPGGCGGSAARHLAYATRLPQSGHDRRERKRQFHGQNLTGERVSDVR